MVSSNPKLNQTKLPIFEELKFLTITKSKIKFTKTFTEHLNTNNEIIKNYSYLAINLFSIIQHEVVNMISVLKDFMINFQMRFNK